MSDYNKCLQLCRDLLQLGTKLDKANNGRPVWFVCQGMTEEQRKEIKSGVQTQNTVRMV